MIKSYLFRTVALLLITVLYIHCKAILELYTVACKHLDAPFKRVIAVLPPAVYWPRWNNLFSTAMQ